MIIINNLPEYAKSHKYIVATLVNNEWWFWGAYDSLCDASAAADYVYNRELFEIEEIA